MKSTSKKKEIENANRQDGFIIELVLGVTGALFMIMVFFLNDKKSEIGKNSDESNFQLISIISTNDYSCNNCEILNKKVLNKGTETFIKKKINDTLFVHSIDKKGIMEFSVIDHVNNTDRPPEKNVYSLVITKDTIQIYNLNKEKQSYKYLKLNANLNESIEISFEADSKIDDVFEFYFNQDLKGKLELDPNGSTSFNVRFNRKANTIFLKNVKDRSSGSIQHLTIGDKKIILTDSPNNIDHIIIIDVK
ncbi:hypothetical protein [uncultured Psychroserpens sp.]|uniref:hypothetical protein n=1 Tax=uncultured Psychroserpens sp. TaxID=255436 RepID=UPI002639C302|nr:hypothetical protein [uncultured Psychroserpens sp.]